MLSALQGTGGTGRLWSESRFDCLFQVGCWSTQDKAGAPLSLLPTLLTVVYRSLVPTLGTLG